MAKGFFSQGVALLTDGRATIEDIKCALQEHDFEIVKQVPAGENWCFGGDRLIVSFLPEVNGYAEVDVINRPWPDSMGDPKSESMIFAAWSMGYFGPFAFPGGLERARQHARLWKQEQSAPEDSRGFIRIRISYTLGCQQDATVLPNRYDPLAEMLFLSRVVLALFNVPGVVCYFNPNGEVLCDHGRFREIWDACREQKKVPLLLWSNIRFFSLNDDLGFMDTVGNLQLEIRDIEAIFPVRKYSPREIDYYLRNVSHYLLDQVQEIRNGDAIDGPGETNLSWIIELHDKGTTAPPRSVMRLYPRASHKAVQAGLAAIGRSPT